MITGSVTANNEAIIRLTVRGPAGRDQEIETVVDTGFDGSFSLPPALIAALELPWRRRGAALLADGSECVFDIYEGMVLWDGRPRRVAVDEAKTAPLLGMALLQGHVLNVEVRTGGSVSVTGTICHRKLSATKPRPSGYPTDLQNVGDHVRKRRMDMNLLQHEVAAIIGVCTSSIENWERNRSTPHLRTWPAVLEFLGYDPRSPGKTVGEKLRRHRESLGLSWEEAAEILGVNPSTFSRWEHGKAVPPGGYRERIKRFLGRT